MFPYRTLDMWRFGQLVVTGWVLFFNCNNGIIPFPKKDVPALTQLRATDASTSG